MSAMTIFSGSYCEKDTVIKKILKKTNYELITDNDIIEKAADLSGISKKKINYALEDKTSIFNKFTHEKERSLAYLKQAVATLLSKKNFLIDGFSGLLIPNTICHVLRICLIADMPHRVQSACTKKNLDEKDALALLHKEDEISSKWVYNLFKVTNPWDSSLYDIIVPIDKMNVNEIVTLIDNNLKKEVIKPTKASNKATKDFLLAAQVEIALASKGHAVSVSLRDGNVTLTIHNNVLMLARLEEELKYIVTKIKGVKAVETRVGKGFYQADVYRKYDFDIPSKVLLVDDEKEFVQTLSERLMMRDIGSAIAYDGESALNLVAEDEPEVMILDLKMPGIDGIEVLKKVKASQPDIEVIVLTGHGSDVDKKTCMDLGAFAYLQKPVDIELLSATLQKANQKIKQIKK